jgi:hypothetical protein
MKGKEFLRKWQAIWTVALGTIPVAPALFSNLNPQMLPWTPLYALVFLALSTVGLLTPGKWRLAWAIPVTLATGVLCALLAPAGGWFPIMLAWAFYAFLLLWSLQLGSWERSDEMPPMASLVMLAVHLFGQMMLFSDSLKPEPVLTDYGFLLKGSFLAFLLLTVLGLNRGSMNVASGDKRSVTKTMRRSNIWMTLGLFGLAIGASYIPYIYAWIRKAVIWLVAAILWLISRLLPGGDSEIVMYLQKNDNVWSKMEGGTDKLKTISHEEADELIGSTYWHVEIPFQPILRLEPAEELIYPRSYVQLLRELMEEYSGIATMDVAFADVTGDGEEELLLGFQGNDSFGHVYSIVDGVPKEILTYGSDIDFTLCKGGVICHHQADKPFGNYTFISLQKGEHQVIDQLVYDTNNSSWVREKNSVRESIADAEKQEIIDSYGTESLKWMSVLEAIEG